MTLPNPLLALNSTSYNIQMRCYAAWGVLCESEVKMPIWMYIDVLPIHEIAKRTGLTVAEVADLAKGMGK